MQYGNFHSTLEAEQTKEGLQKLLRRAQELLLDVTDAAIASGGAIPEDLMTYVAEERMNLVRNDPTTKWSLLDD